MQPHHPLRPEENVPEKQAIPFPGVILIGNQDSLGSSHKVLLCCAVFCVHNNQYLQLADCFQ